MSFNDTNPESYCLAQLTKMFFTKSSIEENVMEVNAIL